MNDIDKTLNTYLFKNRKTLDFKALDPVKLAADSGVDVRTVHRCLPDWCWHLNADGKTYRHEPKNEQVDKTPEKAKRRTGRPVGRPKVDRAFVGLGNYQFVREWVSRPENHVKMPGGETAILSRAIIPHMPDSKYLKPQVVGGYVAAALRRLGYVAGPRGVYFGVHQTPWYSTVL
jgi:hypothetical protein